MREGESRNIDKHHSLLVTCIRVHSIVSIFTNNLPCIHTFDFKDFFANYMYVTEPNTVSRRYAQFENMTNTLFGQNVLQKALLSPKYTYTVNIYIFCKLHMVNTMCNSQSHVQISFVDEMH